MLFIWIVFFLFLSALFSGAEIAFVSADKLRIELKKKRGNFRSAILTRFYDHPAHFIGTMLVGNNIALVAFTTLVSIPFNSFLASVIGTGSDGVLLLLNTFFITLVVLVFGEFLPKTLARIYADDLIYNLAGLLRFIQILLGIPTRIMTKLTDLVLKVFLKTGTAPADTAFTRLDLENFIANSSSHSEEEIDRELFGKALNLHDIKVRDCMVPRTEMENIDITASVDDLIRLIQESKLSRIIVTDGDMDNVKGYVHHQQLLKQPQSIEECMMDIPFVPEVMRATDLMNVLIKKNVSIACVVDEFGGVSGLITLEDIIEEIFGEIEDEYDQEEYIEQVVGEGEYLFSGRLEIDYLNEKYPALKFADDNGDYNTLSGYIIHTEETIPEQGSEIIIGAYKFIPELVSNTKIETVRVVKIEPVAKD